MSECCHQSRCALTVKLISVAVVAGAMVPCNVLISRQCMEETGRQTKASSGKQVNGIAIRRARASALRRQIWPTITCDQFVAFLASGRAPIVIKIVVSFSFLSSRHLVRSIAWAIPDVCTDSAQFSDQQCSAEKALLYPLLCRLVDFCYSAKVRIETIIKK